MSIHDRYGTICIILKPCFFGTYRVGVAADVFTSWNLALVKEGKASPLADLFEEQQTPEQIDLLPLSRLKNLCGAQFENFQGFGLEHADPRPPTPKYGQRRQEQGIKIR